MWDQSIAVEPSTNEATSAVETSGIGPVIEAVATSGPWKKLKTILIPAVLVIAVIMVAYILWKYFTKYRKAKPKIPVIEEDEIVKPSSPARIIAMEDMSRFECESDSDTPPPIRSKTLPVIQELPELESSNASEAAESTRSQASDHTSEASSENESSDEEASENEASDDESDDGSEKASTVDADDQPPDLEKIEQLIEDTEADGMFSIDTSYTDPVKPKKTRRMKRVVL